MHVLLQGHEHRTETAARVLQFEVSHSRQHGVMSFAYPLAPRATLRLLWLTPRWAAPILTSGSEPFAKDCEAAQLL